VVELIMDRLPNLADACKPAPQCLGPRPLTGAPRRTDDLSAVGRPPCRMVGLAFKALVHDVRTQRGRPDTGPARRGLATQGKKGFGRVACDEVTGQGGDTQQGGAAACVIQLDAPWETLGFPYVCSGS